MQKSSFYNVEFFNTPEGAVIVKEDNAPLKVLSVSDHQSIDDFLKIIKDNYPKAYEALDKLYDKSKLNYSFHKFQIAHRFIRCNFGEYDSRKDIDEMGVLHFEEVHCPLRGECPLDGVVCHPKSSTNLTKREMTVLDMVGVGLDYTQIAGKLSISVYTVKRHAAQIRRKIGCRNVLGLIDYYNRKIKR